MNTLKKSQKNHEKKTYRVKKLWGRVSLSCVTFSKKMRVSFAKKKEGLRLAIEESRENRKKRVEEKINQRVAFEAQVSKNPYLQSRVLWNDMYGDLQTRVQNCYKIIMILSIVIVVSIIGMISIASSVRVRSVPFIVRDGEAISLAGQTTTSTKQLKPVLASYFAKTFIRAARSVSADGDVNANHRITAYSFLTAGSIDVLKDFYSKNDPDVIAQRHVKDISIESVLRESPHTLEIRWQERLRGVRSGALILKKNYIGQLTYQYGNVSQNTAILKNNPMGFQITHLAWSEDKN